VAEAMRLLLIVLPHTESVGTFAYIDGTTVQKASLPTKVNLVDHFHVYAETVAAL
jgi:hypothetical protein